jgi:hypothetical protein
LECLPGRRAFYYSFRALQLTLIGLSGFLLFLFLIFLTVHISKSARLTHFVSQKKILTDQMTVLAKFNNESGDVKTRISSLTEEIALKKRLLSAVGAPHDVRFSTFLEELSKKTPNDLWISKIEIMPQKEYVSIEGGALRSDLVPLFMHHLADVGMLKQKKFSVISIKSTSKNYFDFTVQTKTIETELGSSHK